MKKVKSIFMKPTILLGIAAVLLLGSGVGSARSFFKGEWKGC